LFEFHRGDRKQALPNNSTIFNSNKDNIMESSKQTSDEEYVLAGESTPPANSGMKRGHKCCGGCCDVKRATIIVNLVSMGMALFGLLAVLAASNMSDLNDDNFNYTEEELAAMEVYSGSVPMAVTYTLCRMALNALGIWGAYSYKVWPIGASLAAFAAEFLMSLIALNLPGAIYFGCFAYPHVYLIQEIRSGIMSKETYETEKQSCCCV